MNNEIMSSLISLLKCLALDVGKASMKHKSAGKFIAFSFVPEAN